uniref:Uncharacterized protein n=1 Tax=Ditylenchus dipsaci TaxID=166011 RepID=A0A915E7P5_9BILA
MHHFPPICHVDDCSDVCSIDGHPITGQTGMPRLEELEARLAVMDPMGYERPYNDGFWTIQWWTPIQKMSEP